MQLQYPELLALPIMMLADYFLTLRGKIEQEKVHARHFKTEQYELNPVWQKDVEQTRWFNPRHLAAALILPLLISLCLELGRVPAFFAKGAISCILTVFAVILGRHLNNLLLFRHLQLQPGGLSGEVRMSHLLALRISQYQMAMVALPLLLLLILQPTASTFGALLGLLLLVLLHGNWIRLAAKKGNAAANGARHD